MRRIAVILMVMGLCLLTACSNQSSPGMDDIAHARSAYSKGFYLEAERDYERYLQAESRGEYRREAWERLAEIAISVKGDYDRAVVLLEAMYLELGTDQETAWKIMYQLGDVYAELGNLPKAIEAFEKCMVHAAGNPEHMYKTQLRMARLYRRMGSYDMVASTLENCAGSTEDPEAKAQCLYELAQSYTFIESWTQAHKVLDSLLALKGVSDETRSLAIFLLADVYENDRDYVKTRELLTSILKTYPNPKVVETRLANLPRVAPRPLPLVPPKQ